MRFVLFGFALLAVALPHLNATSYYVDYLAGSDSNLGTNPKTPWKDSPGDPAAMDNVANASLSPGDTVVFKGGVTYEFTSATGIALNWNGAPGAVITPIPDATVYNSPAEIADPVDDGDVGEAKARTRGGGDFGQCGLCNPFMKIEP